MVSTLYFVFSWKELSLFLHDSFIDPYILQSSWPHTANHLQCTGLYVDLVIGFASDLIT